MIQKWLIMELYFLFVIFVKILILFKEIIIRLKSQLLCKHWNINQMINFNSRQYQLIEVFKIFIIKLIPKIEYIGRVFDFPAFHFVPFFAILVKHKEKPCICSRVNTLGKEVATFLLAAVACVTQSDQKLELSIGLQQSLF
jgi:hypothetical protein